MNKFNYLFKWSWTFLVAVTLTLGLAGCEGDDGAPGAAGAPGTPGADGQACWDLDGDGVGDVTTEDINGDGFVDVNDCAGIAKVTPVESCAVCHGDGAVLDATANHALPPIEAVSNVAFAVNGADLEVTFDLAADGVPAPDYDQIERGYRNDGATRTTIVDSLTLTNNGGGNYTITVAGGAAEAAIDNRYLFRVAAGADRETRVYFYGDFPASPVEDLAISAQACNACHGKEGIDVHGGYFAANDGGEPCLTCHGVEAPDRDTGLLELIPRLVTVAHGYHSSIWEEDGEVVEVTYPTYMNNCSVCHATDDQLLAVNAMPIAAEGCFSCHGSIAGIPFSAAYAGLHANFNEATDCQGCHQVGGIANNVVAVTDVHNGATTERGGVIWDGEDTSVTEGARINWEITGVADDGTDLTITWQATYDNGAGPVGVDPCNTTPGAGTPAFHAIPPLTRPDGSLDDRNNISIIRNYAQGEDFILGPRANQTGQPNPDVDVTTDNTTCAGNVATTVISVEDDIAASIMYGRVGMQGKPWVEAIDPDDADGVMQVRAKSPTFDWVVGEGGAAPARRAIVDTTGKCLNCHVGSMYQHGGNRVDNINLCQLCHNSAANDEYVRVAGFGVDASEAYDGRAGQAFGMKEMLHAVHSAGRAAYDSGNGAPIVIYRGRGIYGWASDVSLLNNWPTESDCVFGNNDTPGNIVVGSEDAPPAAEGGARPCQAHNFHTPTFPRGLYDCLACHSEDDPLTSENEAFVSVFPDASKAMATTVEAGDPLFGNQLNDVLEGVNASSCMTCHRSGEAAVERALKAHAYQNGWEPQEFEDGRQTIIEANQ